MLAFVVASELTQHYITRGQDPGWPLKFWGLLFFILNLGLGFWLITMVLRPVYRFVSRVRKSKAVATKKELPVPAPKNEFEEISQVFEEVTGVLDKVQSKNEFPGIIGQSRAIRGVFSQILKVAPSDSTVLITGESGTGKELVATAVHEQSPRKDKPLIRLNCMAIPKDLLESELFGYEKGAFTGATKRKAGRFEQAHGGTIFLDEIGDMPLETQGKILRVIQEREIQRVGGDATTNVDVRIIAATNKNLSELTQKQEFREDLFFRLNVFPVHLPPLRQRREDIALLAEYFLDGIAISGPAMQQLISYDWPGNIRQLQNVLQRAGILAEQKEITADHLPASVNGGIKEEVQTELLGDQNLDERLAVIEKGLIENALKKCGGVQVRAAELLGIKPRSLMHRIQKYEVVVKKDTSIV